MHDIAEGRPDGRGTVTRKAGQLFSVQALFFRKAASRMSLRINKQLKCTLF